MTRRLAVLIWAGTAMPAPAPPGIDPAAYAAAMFEDVAEVLHGLAGVDSLVLCGEGEGHRVRDLLWPDVPVVEVPEPIVRAAAAAATQRGYQHVGVVATDAPDIPQLVLAKLFQALARSPVAIAAETVAETMAEAAPRPLAAAVAVGIGLPAPPWLPATIDLDSATVVTDLQAAAPDPADVRLTPGWRRLRRPEDVSRLDPGLEGWEATRALLAGLRSHQGA